MITNYKLISSKVFSRFKNIPERAFYDFYFFYQHYFDQIVKLEYDEYIEIKFNYIEALYKLDKYSLFYSQADAFISELINHQFFNERQQLIFEKVLFYKAEAYKNENKIEEACKIYAELVKWKANNKEYSRKLFSNLFQAAQINQQDKIAFVVVFLLASLVLTGISIFIINPFYPQHKETLISFRNLAFAGGIISFVGLQLMYFRKAKMQMIRMLKRQEELNQMKP